MAWEFNNDKPIYIQLIDRIKLNIISGEMEIGSKLDSVRDLSEIAGVNPNTMQRALTELEREGLVFSQRTSGRYVTEDKELIKSIRKIYAEQKIIEVAEFLLKLGYTKEELLDFIQEYLEELN